MNEGRKISSHTVSTQIDEAIYNYMTSSCRDRNTAYFCLFFQRNTSIHIFYIKTALYISLMSVPGWDLPTGKKESFWVNPSLISFCSLIFYFVFFIFLLLSLFVFWQTKCAHEKKKINLRAKNSNYVFWPAADCFRALRVSDEGVFISTNQSAVFQYSFRFNTSPRNDKMHK